MTQEEIAAWVSAGAAVAQAVGAIAAIWASFRIATRAEQRSADAVREAGERERAAEAASVARAEAAERRAEQREEAVRQAELRQEADRIRQRRTQVVALVGAEVRSVIMTAETTIARYVNAQSTVSASVTTGAPIVEIIDSQKTTLQDADLFPYLLAVRSAARDLEQLRTAWAPTWVDAARSLLDALRDAMCALEAAI